MLRSHSLKNFLLCLIAVVACASLPQASGNVIAQVAGTNPDEIVFIRPARRATDARPDPLPDLPHPAGRVAPLTLEIVTRRHSSNGATHRTRHWVARTVDRIHMTFADGREWLFERNPLDSRRVSGQLIVHGTRTIVLQEESDLRNRLGLNGWADVLMIGLDPGVVSQLKSTGRTRTIGGVRFVNQTLQGRNTRTSDVWWSDEYALPGAFDVRDETGSTRVSVERLRAGVDAEVLRPPSLRFPQYRVVDLAEWLEGH